MCWSDIPAVTGIERRAFANPWSEETFSNLLRRMSAGAELWVVEHAEVGIVGYAVLWCILDQGELANIAVHPDFLGQGYARRLLGFLLDLSRDRGVASVFLEVRASNERAQALYERMGFERVGARRAYYDNPREDAHVLKALL